MVNYSLFLTSLENFVYYLFFVLKEPSTSNVKGKSQVVRIPYAIILFFILKKPGLAMFKPSAAKIFNEFGKVCMLSFCFYVEGMLYAEIYARIFKVIVAI